MLKDNPSYKVVFRSEVHGIDFYAPVETAEYHMSRYVAAGAQNIFSASGATKDFLEKVIDKMLDICNNERSKDTIRTDIGTLCNNMKARMKYPVDEDCAIRMGAIYSIMEGENPDEVKATYTERKVKLAHEDPDLYAFFLGIGISSTPSWKDYGINSLTMEYFQNRKDMLRLLELEVSKV